MAHNFYVKIADDGSSLQIVHDNAPQSLVNRLKYGVEAAIQRYFDHAPADTAVSRRDKNSNLLEELPLLVRPSDLGIFGVQKSLPGKINSPESNDNRAIDLDALRRECENQPVPDFLKTKTVPRIVADENSHPILRHRAEYNMTLDELSQKAGVMRGMIERIEQGNEIPTDAILQRIADVFGVEQNALRPGPKVQKEATKNNDKPRAKTTNERTTEIPGMGEQPDIPGMGEQPSIPHGPSKKTRSQNVVVEKRTPKKPDRWERTAMAQALEDAKRSAKEREKNIKTPSGQDDGARQNTEISVSNPPKIAGKTWSTDDIEILRTAIAEGKSVSYAQSLFPGRTEKAVSVRFYRERDYMVEKGLIQNKNAPSAEITEKTQDDAVPEKVEHKNTAPNEAISEEALAFAAECILGKEPIVLGHDLAWRDNELLLVAYAIHHKVSMKKVHDKFLPHRSGAAVATRASEMRKKEDVLTKMVERAKQKIVAFS